MIAMLGQYWLDYLLFGQLATLHNQEAQNGASRTTQAVKTAAFSISLSFSGKYSSRVNVVWNLNSDHCWTKYLLIQVFSIVGQVGSSWRPPQHGRERLQRP
jgi:hypothetical protein